MNSITITHAMALEGLQKALKVKGQDYVYDKPGNACLYTHDGEPSCVVGYVLMHLGVPVEALEELNPEGAITGSGAQEVLERHDVHIDSNALDLLDIAQMEQDSMRPWGVAVQTAITAVPA